jgi:hypothetical protein
MLSPPSTCSVANRVHSLTQLYDRRSGEMLHQLLRGAPVEHGAHMAELEELYKGSVRTTSLVIR